MGQAIVNHLEKTRDMLSCGCCGTKDEYDF